MYCLNNNNKNNDADNNNNNNNNNYNDNNNNQEYKWEKISFLKRVELSENLLPHHKPLGDLN